MDYLLWFLVCFGGVEEGLVETSSRGVGFGEGSERGLGKQLLSMSIRLAVQVVPDSPKSHIIFYWLSKF